jgi:hypothetical protein
MFRLKTLYVTTAIIALAATATSIHASSQSRTLVVTMTNDAKKNEINVYDAQNHALLQQLSTEGEGGAGGNARGVKEFDGTIVAVVNNGSNTVAIFSRVGDGLKFDKVVSTTSAPVSVDFGNDHMYVAGATTVDSFTLRERSVGFLDGTTELTLAGGGIPPAGSTAQVGVVGPKELLVTLKTDPDPGTVDVVRLDPGGRVASATPTAVGAPATSLTPFGFATDSDGTALITLAHSNQIGLFRDGSFTSVITPGQAAGCWMTRVGKYVFVANTGSKTITRVVGTGTNVFVDSQIAGNVPTGSPADIDGDAGVLGVVDHGAGQSHLTLFSFNQFGDLTPSGLPINVGVPNANGIAILTPRSNDNN